MREKFGINSKKIIIMMIGVMCILLSACGSKGDTSKSNDIEITEETKRKETYALGQTVGTDVLEITLNKAELTIAVENTHGEDFYAPKEYDPVDDARNPFVASKGHTLVAFTFTAANLDRGSIEFDGSFNPNFLTIEYNNETYNSDTEYGARSTDGLNWETYNSSNVLLLAGEKYMYRAYVDIPVEIENLSDTFTITFSLQDSNGEIIDYSYTITADMSEEASNTKVELTLDQAVNNFKKEEGREYFKNHISEYDDVSGTEIEEIVLSQKWDVVYVFEYGSWTGEFWFEDGGKIRDTYGYENERTWAVDGNNIIIDGEFKCEMKVIKEGLYLLFLDGEPYMILD